MAVAYAALHSGAALIALGPRTLIQVSGGDRASFLHNMCTADIKKLAPGCGCEAFFTNVQGKILGYGYIFAGVDVHLIETAPGQTEPLTAHLDRYIIREDVELLDQGQTWAETLLAGTDATRLLGEMFNASLPAEQLSHINVSLAGADASVRRVDWAPDDAFLIACRTNEFDALRKAILSAGAIPADAEFFDAVRVEHGIPLYGRDITDANLPQEVGRDAAAISFTKGCYLGQETVARIDALGHVNRLLCGLRFGEQTPAVGTELSAQDKVVGSVTSAAFSPKLSAPLALGYVRRGHTSPGTIVHSSAGEAEVVALPF
jgi:folate-binding protein YgfZ